MYKVYYIMHSCFVVELDDRYLLFDFFNKEVIADTVDYAGCLPEFSKDKKLYVFASHSHKDHWWVQNLKLGYEMVAVKYILSKDIRLGRNFLVRNGIAPSIKENIHFVKPLSKYKVDDMEIETLRSTDAGVAFVVNVSGKRIYHAGDLSWWNVEGRGELYGEVYGREYKRALRPLVNKRIDVAFVVEVDEDLDDAFGTLLVHRKRRAVPVARGTQTAQLLQDDASVLVGPSPCMLQEFVAREVTLLDALLGKFLHHLGLGSYRGMVGAGNPQCVLALHAGTTNQDVLNGVVQHVAHVQHTRHVGWRDDDGVGLTSIGFRGEQLIVQPILIPFRFDLFWVVFAC